MRVTILAAGAWGTALAASVAGRHPTQLWARDAVQAIRRYGHLAAEIDPLGSRPMGDPALLPETHGITEDRHL